MTRRNLSVFLYLLLVFASGVVAGSVGYRLYSTRSVSAKPTPEEYRRKYIDRMRSRLSLSDDQVRKINEVLDATRTRYAEFHAKHRPELKAIEESQVDQIRAILDEQQRAEYQKLREERQRERREEKMRRERQGRPSC